MNFINFDALSEHFGRTVADLKQERYATLEALEAQMRREKAEDEARRNATDAEYIRLLKKYFSMCICLPVIGQKQRLLLRQVNT